ncbi:MAG: LacI family transcriptional regulator [Lentisphaerae bacterium]|jgi:LacI family transcriptional regulator|nr:LacI family transcriptional regulator [Lentisphaerota bacterium]
MSKTVLLKDVSARTGCSSALVSAVLNGRTGRIRASEAMRKRIFKVADELGYVPNRNARGLRMSRSFLIGALAANLSSSFVPEILSGIESRCLHTNYGVLLGDYNNDDELFERWTSFQGRGVDGVICIGKPASFKQCILPSPTIKCVFVGGCVGDKECGGVWVDRASLLRLAAQAFAERGHRHIAYLTNYSPAECDAWRNALLTYGIVAGPIRTCHNFFEEGVAVATTILQEHPELTAFFADSDLLGTAILAAARNCGKRVPEDLSVLGIDDSILCRISQPELASLRQPRREQGEKGAELLMQMLDGEPARDIVLQGELVCRASLAQAPENHSKS